MANIISISIYIFINICSSSFGGEKKGRGCASVCPVCASQAAPAAPVGASTPGGRHRVGQTLASDKNQMVNWRRVQWEAFLRGSCHRVERPALSQVGWREVMKKSWSIKILWLCKLGKMVRIIPWNIERNFYKYLQIKRWQCLQEECKLKEKQETKNNKMKETVVSPIVSFRKTLEYVFFFKILFLIELPGKNDTLSWILEDFLFAPVHLSRIWSWTWLLDIFTPLN